MFQFSLPSFSGLVNLDFSQISFQIFPLFNSVPDVGNFFFEEYNGGFRFYYLVFPNLFSLSLATSLHNSEWQFVLGIRRLNFHLFRNSLLIMIISQVNLLAPPPPPPLRPGVSKCVRACVCACVRPGVSRCRRIKMHARLRLSALESQRACLGERTCLSTCVC